MATAGAHDGRIARKVAIESPHVDASRLHGTEAAARTNSRHPCQTKRQPIQKFKLNVEAEAFIHVVLLRRRLCGIREGIGQSRHATSELVLALGRERMELHHCASHNSQSKLGN